jgi:plastocyanin
VRKLLVAAFVVLVAFASFGAGAVAGYFGSAGEFAGAPSGDAYDVEPDARVVLSMSGSRFVPRELSVPAGALVEFELRNDDAIVHTFSYERGGSAVDHVVPPGTTVRVLTRFDEPAAVHFWCSPHTSPDHAKGMVGTLTIEEVA